MTSGVKNVEDQCIMMMNPSYPWTVKVLTERTCASEGAIRSAIRRLKEKGYVEKYSPDNEMTYRVGHKWRLTKSGEARRAKLLEDSMVENG